MLATWLSDKCKCNKHLKRLSGHRAPAVTSGSSQTPGCEQDRAHRGPPGRVLHPRRNVPLLWDDTL